MAASKLQQQVTQTLAEAFNLLVQAELSGLRGAQVAAAAKSIEGFREIIGGLANETLLVTEAALPAAESTLEGDFSEVV